MPGLLDDLSEYGRRSGRNLGGLLDWLGGGARAGAEPIMGLLRGDALNEPFLPTATSGGRIGAVASAVGSTLMPVAAPTGAMGAGPVLRGTNAALDMSPEARAARAAEQGYVWDAYHGTQADIPEFDLSKIGTGNDRGFYGEGLYFSPNPDVANDYAHTILASGGGNVIPAKLRMGNPFIYPTRKTHGDAYKQALEQESQRLGVKLDASINEDPAALTAALKRAGHDGIVVLNRSGKDEYVVFEPSQARSRFAAFDPARVGEADLLASRVPLSGLLAPIPDDKRKR